jgi:hypothetical protein
MVPGEKACLSACLSLSEANASVGWRFREETVWGAAPGQLRSGRLILLVISCGIGCWISNKGRMRVRLAG